MFEKLENQRQRKEALFDFKLSLAVIVVVSIIFGYVSGFIAGSLLHVGMPAMLAIVFGLLFFIIPVWLTRKLVWPELKAMYRKINDTN